MENNIFPIKETFVTAWTCINPDFGNKTTSWVEGAHATLKQFLANSLGNLLDVWKSLDRTVLNQIKSVHASLYNSQIKLGTVLPPELLPLGYKLSLEAIHLVREQFEKFKRDHDGKVCTKSYFKTMGLPCSHQIGDRLAFRGSVVPKDVHPQWRLDYDPCSSSSVSWLKLDCSNHYVINAF